MRSEIILILDRSGSMSSIKNDMEGALNTFIAEQQKIEGEARITLVQFDTEYEEVFVGKDLHQGIEKISIVPRGGTALLDAIGKTIDRQGERFRYMSDSRKPEKVIVAIITDGEENSSIEYTRDRVFKMISRQRKEWNWSFYFFGANQDAIKNAESFGIGRGQTISYAANRKGVDRVVMLASAGIGHSRSTGYDNIYTAEEQESAVDSGLSQLTGGSIGSSGSSTGK